MNSEKSHDFGSSRRAATEKTPNVAPSVTSATLNGAEPDPKSCAILIAARICSAGNPPDGSLLPESGPPD